MTVVRYSGRDTEIAVRKETNWGTDPGSGEFSPGKLLDATLRFGNNLQTFRGMGTGSLNIADIVAGGYDVGGSMRVNIRTGQLLEGVLGDSTYSTSKHTFAGTTTTIPSWTMIFNKTTAATDDVDNVTGCFITSISLNQTLNGVLTASIEFIGKKNTNATTAVNVTESTEAMPNWDGAVLTWNSADVLKLQSVTLGITINYQIDRSLSNRFIEEPIPIGRDFKITPSFKLNTTDRVSMKQDAMTLGETAKTGADGPWDNSDSADMNLRTAVVKFVRESGVKEFRFTMANCAVFDYSETSSENDTVNVNATISGKSMSAEVWDGVESDY